jgi:hypothetical protein
LKVFQSVDDKAPVVDVLDNPKDSTWPARLSPLAVPRVTSPVLVPELDPEKLEAVIAPEKLAAAAVIVPVRVGDADKTTFPVPVVDAAEMAVPFP